MHDVSHVFSVDQVKLVDGAPRALRRLRYAGFRLFVVTNQSGVGRGYFTHEVVEAVHARLNRHFSAAGVQIDRYYVCPHHPEENCDCRKPKPKFLLEASRDYGLDLTQCFMVGDRPTDIQCGRNAGTKTVLVLTGAGCETRQQTETLPDKIAADIGTAADWILEQR